MAVKPLTTRGTSVSETAPMMVWRPSAGAFGPFWPFWPFWPKLHGLWVVRGHLDLLSGPAHGGSDMTLKVVRRRRDQLAVPEDLGISSSEAHTDLRAAPPPTGPRRRHQGLC